jgi:MinD-like ATPase involved in chromosome partitioning or flagellar assembly
VAQYAFAESPGSTVKETQKPGEIMTFYSYKGGVGRSMALANVACILAKRANPRDKGVLLVDWDLEAPGLHRFFEDPQQRPRPLLKTDFARPGLIDLFAKLRTAIEKVSSAGEEPTQESEDLLRGSIRLSDFLLDTGIEKLDLITAGRFDKRYPRKVSTFPWSRLHKRAPWIFSWFGNLLAELYDYVLIDSRSGVSDTGGICTAIIPEKLVLVFAPNQQNIEGVLEQAATAANYRTRSDDIRPLMIFPLPSRIEPTLDKERHRWRRGTGIGYQGRFEALFQSLYSLPECSLNDYFDEVQIQQTPDYAYGEQIAVLSDTSTDRFSLPRSYEAFVDRLSSEAAPWESLSQNNKSVFISYAAADKEFAERIYSDLQKQGVRTWFAPASMRTGDRIAEQIVESIRNADKMLVILSKNSVDSGWVRKEIDLAFEKEKDSNEVVLLPVRLDDAVLKTGSNWAADIRRLRQIGDFSDWRDENQYQSALNRLLQDSRLAEKK